MKGHPWNELPDCCGGPALTEEGAAAGQGPCVRLRTFGETDRPAPGLGLSSGALLWDGPHRGPSTASGTAEPGAPGLLICVSDKLNHPYWRWVLYMWFKTPRRCI